MMQLLLQTPKRSVGGTVLLHPCHNLLTVLHTKPYGNRDNTLVLAPETVLRYSRELNSL